jgi:hypothetical protein
MLQNETLGLNKLIFICASLILLHLNDIIELVNFHILDENEKYKLEETQCQKLFGQRLMRLRL